MSHVPSRPARRRFAAAGLAALSLIFAAGAPTAAATPSTTQAATKAGTKAKAKAKANARAKARARARRRADAQGVVVHVKGTIHGAAPEAPRLRFERWESHTGLTNSYYERLTDIYDADRSLETWSSTGVGGYASGRFDRPLRERLGQHQIDCFGSSDPYGPEWEGDSLTAIRQADALRRDPAAFAALPAGALVHGRPTRVARFDPWADNVGLRALPFEVHYDAESGDVVRTGRAGEDFWFEFTLWELLPGDASIAKAPPEIQAYCD